MNPIDQQKKRLRHELRQAGRDLTKPYRLEASANICDSLRQLIRQQITGGTIASFLALPDEPQLHELIQTETDLTWALPRIETSKSIHFYQVHSKELDHLVKAKFGLREPHPQLHKEIPAEQIDAIFIPASGLSRDGKRLGKGGGFYDRYLPKLRHDCLKIGVVYETQIRDQLPTASHDCQVDWIITEKSCSQAEKP